MCYEAAQGAGGMIQGKWSLVRTGRRELAFGELSRLGVELHSRRVLDAVEVPALRAPDLLHAGTVDQRDAHAVCHVPEVTGELLQLGGQLGGQLDLLGVPPLLGLLGLFQAGHVFGVPLKNGEGKPHHEEAVELVAVGGRPSGKTLHEMPHVQPDDQLVPLVEQLRGLSLSHGGTAVPVHVQDLQRGLPGFAVPPHQSGRHVDKSIPLSCSEDGHEHLPVLVADVGDPGGRPGSTARKLFGDLCDTATRQHLDYT